MGSATRTSDADQNLRKVGNDPPIVDFIGIGERRTRHFTAESHVVQLATHRSQASLDFAQTFPVPQLSEDHRQVLITASEAALRISPLACDTLVEFVPG
jgi:hypothetical protein